MSDLPCRVCGEPWDAYGARHGDMEPWEYRLFAAGHGCPACEGQPPADEPSEERDAREERYLRTALLDDPTDDEAVEVAAMTLATLGSIPPVPWAAPAPVVLWECAGCGVRVMQAPETRENAPFWDAPVGKPDACRNLHRLEPSYYYPFAWEGDREPKLVCGIEPQPVRDADGELNEPGDGGPYRISLLGSYRDLPDTAHDVPDERTPREADVYFCHECATSCDECGAHLVYDHPDGDPYAPGYRLPHPVYAGSMNPGNLCTDCYEELHSLGSCSECGEYAGEDNLREVEDRGYLCEECAPADEDGDED